MPRGNARTSSTSRSAAAAVAVVEPEVKVKPKPIFPLVVDSFHGPLPGDPGYDPAKDRLLLGFKFGNSTVPSWLPSGTKREEIDTYDFLTHPATGKRRGQTIEPHDCAFTDLEYGVKEYASLPPIHIWKQGMWLADVIFEEGFDTSVLPKWIETKVKDAIKDGWDGKGKTPPEIFNYYVTSGEGTTGNNLYRIYELPKEICTTVDPHHPMNWPQALVKKLEEADKARSSSWRSHTQGGNGWAVGQPRPTATVTPVAKAPTIPAGVRYRCVGCGHWFTQMDLVGHAQVCGKGEDADWAMMCHSDCGCKTLDEASRPKPGFPRAKASEPEATTEKEGDQPSPPPTPA